MRRAWIQRVTALGLVVGAGLSGCGGDSVDEAAEPLSSAGAAGSGASAGKAGASGKGGASGKAGASGKGGGGSSGNSSAGHGGGAGFSGQAGEAGMAGQAGEAGASGQAGSGAGAAGSGGEAGAGGEAGSAGSSGEAGAAGGAGASGNAGADLFDEHALQRLGCKFKKGDKASTSISSMIPHGDALPFKHVVVLMLENRSFDHYFSKLPEVGVTDVDVATEEHANPDPDKNGELVHRYHETRYCIEDTEHNWEPVHTQWAQGKMNGFVATNNPGGARAMGYYDQSDFPFYYWLARTFSISDRHFSSLLGPTWPNRFYFYGATSWGRTKTPDIPPIGKTKITDLLEDAGRKWKVYRDGLVSFGVVFGLSYTGVSLDELEQDIKNDALPDLSIIDPSFNGSSQNDEHPPSNVQKGQALSHRVVKALFSNPEVWKKTVLFITYDEHGGLYDHVAPPLACVPDDDTPPSYAFDTLGIRVPLLVVSPFTRKGYVSHLVSDHTSITRFIENRFDLPAMTARDANAWPLLDMFDFENPPFPLPPSEVPDAPISPEGEQWCKSHDPGTGLP